MEKVNRVGDAIDKAQKILTFIGKWISFILFVFVAVIGALILVGKFPNPLTYDQITGIVLLLFALDMRELTR